MISYGQNREDVLLDRVFRGVPAGFYIDVGANHPEVCSVTRHFYDLGWRGINIEPSDVYRELAAQRTRDVNLHQALSNRPGRMTLYTFPGAEGLSTLCAAEAAEHRLHGRVPVEQFVDVVTLRTVCEDHVSGTVDFLSIDVEGHEREVIEGGDWVRFRPRVVLVEATRPMVRESTQSGWEPLLLKADYRFAFFDGLNRYYVRAEDDALLQRFDAPVCVFDDYEPAEWTRQVAKFKEVIYELEATIAERQARLEEVHNMLLKERGDMPLGKLAKQIARGIQRMANGVRGLPRLFRPDAKPSKPAEPRRKAG